MDMEHFFVLLSIVAGAAGYLAVTFWFQPILKYREIKARVAADLVFFANALDLWDQFGTLREGTVKRKENNRRCASEIEAIYSDLPGLYRWWLQQRNESPKQASIDLIELANSRGKQAYVLSSTLTTSGLAGR